MKYIPLVCLVAVVSTLNADLVPMTPGQYMRGQLAGSIVQFAATVGEWASRNQELEDEIVTARREFWESPDGARRIAAAKRFDEALAKRDLHYVVARMLDSPGGRAPLMALARDLSGVHRVDGGISPYCYGTYKVWADDVINLVAQRVPLEQAVKQALPRYSAYLVERDLTEYLFFNPHSILRADRPDPRDYLAAWILGTKYARSAAAANAEADKIAGKVSGTRLAEIVHTLRQWTAVTYHLQGPWEQGPQAVLDPLISGVGGSPTPRDWSPQRLAFSELRGRLATPTYNEAAALDRVQQLWNSGRANQDLAVLRQAVQERDALLDRIDQAVASNPGLWGGEGRMIFEMVQTNLRFIDRALQGVEIDAMSRGERNPEADLVARQTREYLVTSSKLQPRSITAQRPATEQSSPTRSSAHRRDAAAGAPGSSPVAPAAAAAAGPALPDPGEEGVGPFDRAILLAQNPKAFHGGPGHLSNMLHALAQGWQSASYSKDPAVRTHYFQNTIKQTIQLCKQLEQDIGNQWRALEAHVNRRNNPEARAQLKATTDPLQAVIDELQARIPDMEKFAKAEAK